MRPVTAAVKRGDVIRTEADLRRVMADAPIGTILANRTDAPAGVAVFVRWPTSWRTDGYYPTVDFIMTACLPLLVLAIPEDLPKEDQQ